ncbi:uncharacterized protein PV09_00670 [Verruconis gallopava]|uniref:Cupin type-2 domain-containing protein n=1 Tax=Verruconis gallopava TaxID=253628 RepID=A0A0D2APV6_9PEZI|nr:uncharacterized protein PV09_00670 [Verruconis gallopava]KIW08728.1 hypothetical protein PV09_00670 [Verruconis gallopava]
MATEIELQPLTSLEASSYYIPAHGRVPNSSAQNKPLLIYRNCIRAWASPASIERHLKTVGVVEPQWRYTMYSTSHFHSTTHEVLCVFQGSAELLFGGDDNPENVETTVKAGDVIIVPAGVAHRLITDREGNFEMVGSYPPGASWDMCYGKPGEEPKVSRIKQIEWFKRDPIYGSEGPVLDN